MQSEVGSVSEKHWYFSEVLLVKGALIKAVFLNMINANHSDHNRSVFYGGIQQGSP